MKITKEQAMRLGKKFNIDFKIVPFNEFLVGLNIETEHLNIAKSLQMIAKITIAHLQEDPRYYFYLEKLENKRKKYWSNKEIPKIFLSKIK